jgi:peptidoglycan/xylan/chitin deacetylase (PgdA/CDA1 family)
MTNAYQFSIIIGPGTAVAQARCLAAIEAVEAGPREILTAAAGGDRAEAWNAAVASAAGERLVLLDPEAGEPAALVARHLEAADDLVVLPGSVSMARGEFLAVGGIASRRRREADVGLAFRLCEAGHVPTGEATGSPPPAHAFLTAGRLCATSFAAHPAMRRDLVGTFLSASPRDGALRRAMIAVRIPAAPLAALLRLPRKPKLSGLANRYAFWRGVRGGAGRSAWRGLAGGVPVLMYHAFTPDESHDRYTIPRASLERQLRLLRRLGYRQISVERLGEALRDEEPLPGRTVAITIDDGYRDNLELAWPELRRRGFVATIFMVSGRVGASNDWDDQGLAAKRPLLDADQLRSLHEEGVEIGAHTRHHVHLPDIDAEAEEAEIAGSRRELETLLGAPVRTFAYPYGGFGADDVSAVERAGYLAACTTETRLAAPGDDPLAIPRIEVHDEDSTWTLLIKLWVGGS